MTEWIGRPELTLPTDIEGVYRRNPALEKTWDAIEELQRGVAALQAGAAPLVILDSDANEAIVEETRKENADLRAQLAQLAEAGTGYSQQTMDALARERDMLQAENAKLREESAALHAQLDRAQRNAAVVKKCCDGALYDLGELRVKALVELTALRGLERAVRAIGNANYWRSIAFHDYCDGDEIAGALAVLDGLATANAEGPTP